MQPRRSQRQKTAAIEKQMTCVDFRFDNTSTPPPTSKPYSWLRPKSGHPRWSIISANFPPVPCHSKQVFILQRRNGIRCRVSAVGLIFFKQMTFHSSKPMDEHAQGFRFQTESHRKTLQLPDGSGLSSECTGVSAFISTTQTASSFTALPIINREECPRDRTTMNRQECKRNADTNQ
jgi:hypothetical protein